MKKTGWIIAMAILMLPLTSSAFNGLRKGFVLGGGLGFSPISRWSAGTFDESSAGLALNLIIGYAWDEQNMLVYEGNVTAYSTAYLGNQALFEPSPTISQGFNGASWYHYFGPVGQSFFTVAGLGFYVFQVEDYDANDLGGGYLLGGGYEFTRHVQVAGYFSGGQTKVSGGTFGHNHVSVVVNAVAF